MEYRSVGCGWRIVCADGRMDGHRQAGERFAAVYAAALMDDCDVKCGPHDVRFVREITSDPLS